MKKNEVKVGETYQAKVTGLLVPVRITAVSPHGGWDAINIKTNRPVRIKSPARLRGVWHRGGTFAQAEAIRDAVAETPDATPPATALAEDRLSDGAKNDLAAVRKKTAAPDPALDAAVTEAAKDRKAKKAKNAEPKAERHSLLNLAADVLLKAKKPLSTGEMVEKVLATTDWKTEGKTPAATLYAAILREMKVKGTGSRFVKTGPNLFAHAAK